MNCSNSSLEYLDNSSFVLSGYAVFNKEENHLAVRTVPKTHMKRIQVESSVVLTAVQPHLEKVYP